MILEQIRESHGLSRRDLSSVLGVTYNYVYKLERGDRRISLDMARTISREFGLSLDDILCCDAEPSIDEGKDTYGLWMALRYRGVQQRLRWISPGEFLMGSPTGEAERDNDETQHQVILTQGYWLADTACTQALWQAVMGDDPSRFKGEDRPVENVTWDDVQRFIERLNELAPGDGFRLPTEAEWEYACRAGTTTAFWFGDQITPEQVNYNGNCPYADGRKGKCRKETVEVKALPCNGWGLYQMHGNVWEWCQDWYGDYPAGTVQDPTWPATGDERVRRGGCWAGDGGYARSACRNLGGPGDRYAGLGFRLARSHNK